eukprot:TRINITY_DN27596_c0_g1_i1.p1 TRINITY_DN27596_c0_g1~~TRINITY_DN27596_c0_g1_i1.p1  ORF type:complete len:572 (+),score=165.14 TRINITY_DN27596_c0_g1_i1:122-1837(+)
MSAGMETPPESRVLAPPLAVDQAARTGRPPVHPQQPEAGAAARSGSARRRERPPPYDAAPRVAIEGVLEEMLQSGERGGPGRRPGSSGTPHKLSRKYTELMAAMKEHLDSFRPGTSNRTKFKKVSAHQHLGFSLETTERNTAAYNGACWSRAGSAQSTRSRPHTGGAARAHPAAAEAENMTQQYLKEFVRVSKEAEEEVQRCPYPQKWHASHGGGTPPRSDLGDDGARRGRDVPEAYLEHIAAQQGAKQAAQYDRVREANPLDNAEALGTMFGEFQKFCEEIKQRAVDAGRDEDAAAVDQPEVQKTLLERFLDYNMATARSAVNTEGTGSPRAFARTFTNLPAGHGKAAPPRRTSLPTLDAALQSSQERVNSASSQRPKKHPRPRTAPAAAPPAARDTKIAMLMHAPAKSRYHQNLLHRQAAALREHHTTAAPPRRSPDPPVPPAAQPRSPLSDASESPTVQRAAAAPAEPPTYTDAPPNPHQPLPRRQEALMGQMQQHTAQHFRSLQRQQLRHQDKARMLFNRAPVSVRKKIIDRRYQRVMEDNGAGRSACLLFMPPPGDVSLPTHPQPQ